MAYRVQLLVAVQPCASVPTSLESELLAGMPARLTAHVGGYWKVEAHAAAGVMRHHMLRKIEEVKLAHIEREQRRGDKLILLAIRAGVSNCAIETRELDMATGVWNTPQRIEVRQPAMIPHEAQRAVFAAFAPLARIDTADSTSARVRLRGASLLPTDPPLAPVSAGSVFLPVLVRTNSMSTVLDGESQVVPWSFLIGRFTSGTSLECRLESGLAGSPIPDYHPHQARLAVYIIPPRGTTNVRLLRQGESSEPLEAYEVWVRRSGGDDAAPPEYERVGRTDRMGICTIPRGDELVRHLRVKQGPHVFADVPIVPGLVRELTLSIDDDPRRIMIEAALEELDDRLTDLLVQRASLASRIQSHRDRDQKQQADTLQQQLDKLPVASRLLPDIETQERAIAALGDATKRRLAPRIQQLRSRIETAASDAVTAGSPPAD